MANKTETIVLEKGSGTSDETATQTWIEQVDGTHAPPVAIPSLLIPDVFKTLKAVNIAAIATVWTPAAGKKVRLMGGSISVSAAVSVLFENNGAGTDVYQTPTLAANSPYSFDLGNGISLGTINNVLKATASGAATITGTLYGKEE